MISSVEFAKFLLKKAKEANITLDTTQLHKLLYICHGVILSCDVDLIKDFPNAWVYGPVYPAVADWLDADPEQLNDPDDCSSRALKEIEAVTAENAVRFALKHFGTWDGDRLSIWSHDPGGPWAYSIDRNGRLDGPLYEEDMKSYFKKIVH